MGGKKKSSKSSGKSSSGKSSSKSSTPKTSKKTIPTLDTSATSKKSPKRSSSKKSPRSPRGKSSRVSRKSKTPKTPRKRISVRVNDPDKAATEVRKKVGFSSPRSSRKKKNSPAVSSSLASTSASASSEKPSLGDVGRTRSTSRVYAREVSRKSLTNVMEGRAVRRKKSSKERAQEEKQQDEEVKKNLPRVGFEDMTQMDDMTLDGVLKNCDLRYKNDLIYTYTGSILVAINPFKKLGIYGESFVRRYVGQRIGLLPPHVYAVAESAYKNMYEFKRNQSILISGESGAGKTESTKLILGFLSGRTEGQKSSGIETKILESVPILEALGNAKTLRNDNSSRFGKYIEIQFDNQYSICGSKILPYLLEKSRIVSQLEGERNYHIFYQLTEGTGKEDRERYHFKRASNYRYLNQSGCYKLSSPDYSEEEELLDFKRALRLFDLSDKVQDAIWRVLSAVLHLGNIEWKGDQAKSQHDTSNEESERAANVVAEMLGLETEQLVYTLSHRRITVVGEEIWKDCTPAQARDLTDAFAKAIYSKLFEWMVNKLNEVTHSEESTNFIGVLDIFGFENFKKNTFEQFLINLANEKLQNYFNHFIFSLEQEEYEREGIDWRSIEFADNKPILDLIEANRPPGLISILNEQCRLQRATDKTLIDAYNQNFKSNEYYAGARLKQYHFSVTHYAGSVEYDCSEWLIKNKDEVPAQLTELMLEDAQNQFVTLLFAPDATTEASIDHAGMRGGAVRRNTTTKTLGGQFKSQLNDLMTSLSATDPFFVRCIKPNMEKKPDMFDKVEIEAQLRYAGMLETIRIRRLGYPIRFSHKDFLYRYQVLDPSYKRIASNESKSCHNLIKKLKIDEGRVQVGKTKVFLKQDLANELDDGRNEALLATIVKIQSWWRMVQARTLYQDMREAAVVIQASFRRYSAQKKYQHKRNAAISIQCAYRQHLARLLLAKRREEYAKYLAKLSAKEKAAREKAEKARAAAEKEEIEALKAGKPLQRRKKRRKGAKAASSKDAKRKKRTSKKRKRLKAQKSILLDRGVKVEIPPVVVGKKISIAVGWESEKKRIMLATTCLMFRYHQFRDAVHDLNDFSRDGAVEHLGFPHWQKKGETDREHLVVNLARVSAKTTTLVFVVNLFSKKTSWDDIENPYFRILDQETGHEYGRFKIDVKDKAVTKGVVMVKLARRGITDWEVEAIGDERPQRNFKSLLPTLAPLLDQEPPTRSFKVSIHRAKKLPRLRKNTPNAYATALFDMDKHKTNSNKSFSPKWATNQATIAGCAVALEIRILAKLRWNITDAMLAHATIELQPGKKLPTISKKWIKLDPSGEVQVSVEETSSPQAASSSAAASSSDV